LFENPVNAQGERGDIPVLVNLFGTVERTAKGIGIKAADLKEFGSWLCSLKQPEMPGSFRETMDKLPALKSAMAMKPGVVRSAPVHEQVFKGEEADPGKLPVQTCWSGEPAPLMTWPLVVTRRPDSEDASAYNIGVYRMQVAGKNKAIVRWLSHRGGAQHHRLWQGEGRDMPMAAVIGADPAMIISAVTPVPDDFSEYHYAGILRGEKLSLTRCKTVPLMVPSQAEIVIEGYVSAEETLPEGPYGDHTGYFNSVEDFPVFNITAITMRKDPVYLSTYTGRPPDEPSIMAQALGDVFLPLLQQQFPEIVDCYLPPEACSYRIAVVSIKKRYPGHARRIMMGLWSHLYQFSYTKMIIVVAEDINARKWEDVMWAVSTRMDPSRDIMSVDNTPMDYLDFASPVSGLGGKLGIDATTKIGSETTREWGRKLEMDDDVVRRIDEMWGKLGIK
jgi:4-hydroxy-3-polyprenylbenzoate decarboxylase